MQSDGLKGPNKPVRASGPSVVSDQLRAAVLAAPLTPYRLAELAGCQRSAISRFLAGKSGLTVDTVDRLAEQLGLRLVQTRRVARNRPKR